MDTSIKVNFLILYIFFLLLVIVLGFAFAAIYMLKRPSIIKGLLDYNKTNKLIVLSGDGFPYSMPMCYNLEFYETFITNNKYNIAVILTQIVEPTKTDPYNLKYLISKMENGNQDPQSDMLIIDEDDITDKNKVYFNSIDTSKNTIHLRNSPFKFQHLPKNVSYFPHSNTSGYLIFTS